MGYCMEQIDWKLLRKQKLHLLEILNDEESSITAEQHISIEGIVSLIDSIQDKATEELSEEIVFALNIPCSFTSEWDDGSIVTTPCVYNEQTGEVEPEVSEGPVPTGMVDREYITLKDGKQIEVCPECHEYVLKTIVEYNAKFPVYLFHTVSHLCSPCSDLSFGEECSNPNCNGCEE